MEGWLRQWLDVDVAPFMMVTADVQLPLPDAEAIARLGQGLVSHGRRAYHDPESLSVPLDSPGPRKRAARSRSSPRRVAARSVVRHSPACMRRLPRYGRRIRRLLVPSRIESGMQEGPLHDVTGMWCSMKTRFSTGLLSRSRRPWSIRSAESHSLHLVFRSALSQMSCSCSGLVVSIRIPSAFR